MLDTPWTEKVNWTASSLLPASRAFLSLAWFWRHLCMLLRCSFEPMPIRVFSHDVTAAILVSQNNETAAMLVSQTIPPGVELFSYANAFFCSNKFAYMLATWVKTLYSRALGTTGSVMTIGVSIKECSHSKNQFDKRVCACGDSKGLTTFKQSPSSPQEDKRRLCSKGGGGGIRGRP